MIAIQMDPRQVTDYETAPTCAFVLAEERRQSVGIPLPYPSYPNRE